MNFVTKCSNNVKWPIKYIAYKADSGQKPYTKESKQVDNSP